MKKEKISEALGNMDTKYIQEAAEYRAATKGSKASKRAGTGSRKTWLKWASAAAAFCLLVVGAVATWQSDFFKKPEQQVDDTRWPIKEVEPGKMPAFGEDGETSVPGGTVGTEDVLVPDWEDMTITQQFSFVDGYSSRGIQMDASYVGTAMETVAMTGYDPVTFEKHTINATLYAVQDFPQECVVAVQFEGRDDYYVYVNSDYRPETLGDFIENLNLRDNVSFGSVWYSFWDAGKYTTVEFVDLEDSVVWEMLLSDTDATLAMQSNGGYEVGKTSMSISVDIPLLGYKNISLAVTEDGYLTTNILDTGKVFFIGKDKVQAFMEYVIENCEGYELVYKTTGEEEGEPEAGAGELEEPQFMPITSDDGLSGAEGKVTDAPQEQNGPEATPAVATPVPPEIVLE